MTAIRTDGLPERFGEDRFVVGSLDSTTIGGVRATPVAADGGVGQ